jgi:hypothetical protein
MASRLEFIERCLRQIYGDLPTDASSITKNLVNSWLNDAIAAAAKKNWTDNLQIDQIAYVNNSFYTTFKNLVVSDSGELFLYQLTLPDIPVGIGRNEAVSTLQFIDSSGNVSDPAIPLSQAQIGYFRTTRPIPNKILYYPEGTFLYAISTLQLNNYTGKVKMISGGDKTDLNSVLNVPSDYWGFMTDYIKMQLAFERAQPKELTNDKTEH